MILVMMDLEYALEPLVVFLSTVCKRYTDTFEDNAKYWRKYNGKQNRIKAKYYF